ncbi:MAG: tetratricopeptide repeat protein [Chitinispirillales bacterium]|nr:tetratricopeptide repeat protein [Chitinispirillales bacterium]
MKHRVTGYLLCPLIVVAIAVGAVADETFYKMIRAGNYSEAVKYADDRIPPTSRDGQLWASIGLAHENLNAPEKALACYLVGMKMDENNYDTYLGAARVYNTLKQSDNAKEMAEKAMSLRQTGEASWEFARACIGLGKAKEAKAALEKVVESDPNNVVANRELGRIYYDAKDFNNALPLMKKSLARQMDGELALRIALAHKQLGQTDAAIEFFNKAASDKSTPKPEVIIELARLYYDAADYNGAVQNFDKANKSMLTAEDLYAWAVSLENTKADSKAVVEAYGAAVSKFGNSTIPAALAAREKLGRAHLARKSFREAESALSPLNRADPDGKIVPDIALLMAQVNEGLGNPNQAIGFLEKAIAKDKNNVEAYARLADLYAKSGQSEKANATQKKLVSLDPNNPKIHLSLGEYHLKGQKYTEALSSFQKSFTLQATAEAAVGMMNAAWNLKRFDLARDAAESALHRDPSLKDPQLMLAKIYMAEKNYLAARGVLLPLLKVETNDLGLWRDLAECSEKTGDVGTLADADKRIVALDPKDVPSRVRVAKAAEKSGDLKTAYDTFKELANLQPKDADIQKSLYEIAIKQKNNPAASTHLKALLSLRPNDAEGHRELGNMQFASGDMSGALASYRAAVKADPRIKGMYQNYATILMKDKTPTNDLMPVLIAAVNANEANEAILTAAGNEYQKQDNYSKAAEMYQKALLINPKNMTLLSSLALCQEKSGRIAEAILTYEQVTLSSPGSTAEYKSLGDLYVQQKKMPQAVAAYKKYLEKVPTATKIARLVGDHEFAQKNWAEASKYYGMVSGTDANNADYLRNFGTACFEAKNYARAGMLFKQLSDANPKDAESLKKLYEIETLNKNPRGASEQLKKYVALVPGDASMQKTLGDMLFDNGDKQGALSAYRAAMKLDPSIKGIHKRFVDLLKDASSAERISAMNAAIAANEADAPMYAQLGELYKAGGNCKAAIPVLEQAMKLDAKNTGVMAAIADCHVKGGNTGSAVLALEQVTLMNPSATAEYKMLGDLYVQQRKPAEAVKAYKKFLEKGSDNAAARLVGEEAFKAKNWAEAVKYLSMVKGEERNPAFLEMIGKAAFENKDNLRAVDTYKTLSAMNPQNAEYVKMLYDLAGRMGAREDAVNHLKKYVSIKPQDAEMQKTLGDLLYDRKDKTGALAAYKAALAVDPRAKGFHKRYVELMDGGGGAAQDKITAMEGAIAAGEADAQMLIKLGNIYRDQKQPAKAVPLFEKAVKENKNDVQLLVALAQSQEAAGMINEAITTYEQYVLMDPKASKEHKTLGNLYTKQKKPAEAMRAYKKYLERNSTDNSVSLMVAKEAYNTKQYQEAVRYFAMVQGEEAKKPEFIKMYGTAAFQANDNARALTVLKELATPLNKDPEVFKMLEEVSRRTGASDMAVNYLKQYAALRPQDIEANRKLGDALFDRKDEAGALAAYRAVLKADPNAKGFLKRYVGLVMKAGNESEKMAAFAAAINANEADVGVYSQLGALHKSKGDFAKAASMYEQASKLDPRNADYLGELADCQLKSGNLSGASQNLQQAIMLNPKAVNEYKTLGDLYMQQKRMDQAIDAYKKFLEKSSDSKVAQIVGDYAFEKKQYADAFKYLSMVKDNTSIEYYYSLGRSAQESNNPKAAIDALEKFRMVSRGSKTPVPNRSDVIRALALAYEKEGDDNRAAAAIDEYLKGPPPVKDQDAAYKRAQLIEGKDKKNADAAIRIYEENTSAYPRDYRNFLQAGIYYSRKNNPAKAQQMFEKCVAISDTISRAWYELGMMYGGHGKDKDMLKAFQKFITIEAKNADAILRVGEYLLVTRNMPADAMMFLEMANALKPNDPKIMPMLARGYMRTGRNDEGLKLLERIKSNTRGAPVDIEVRIALGEGYLSLGRNMEAAVEWKAVIDQKREPAYLIKYATALVAMGNRNAEAVGIANEILSKQPGNIEGLMLSGRIKVATRNFEDAMEIFKQIGYNNPNYAPAVYERGNIFLMQQNYDGAKAFFERALKLEPRYALAELGLAKLAKAQKNQAEYNKHLQRAKELEPGNREIQEELKRRQ